jgi:hypothetical protein
MAVGLNFCTSGCLVVVVAWSAHGQCHWECWFVVGASILVAGENTTHVGGVVLYVYVYMKRGCFSQKEMN